VPYYLNEEQGWSMDVAELQKSISDARDKGVLCRALVFINPGNPTGTCLTAANLIELITFCFENRLVLMADEVYQENVYNPDR
jgi:glutamate--glyoxylate aminotransferase